MSDYIDLVVCEVNKRYLLCQAPRWSELHEGDEVVVEGSDDAGNTIRADATVVDSLTVNRISTNDYIRFIFNLFGNDADIETLPKVLEKKTRYVFDYEED